MTLLVNPQQLTFKAISLLSSYGRVTIMDAERGIFECKVKLSGALMIDLYKAQELDLLRLLDPYERDYEDRELTITTS